jgi:hypothetical protein
MPFDSDVDSSAALVTVRIRGCADPLEAVTLARQLMNDPEIDGSYGLLFVVEEITRDSTPEELRTLAEVLKLLGRKFDRHKAIVAPRPGRLTTARMVALLSSTHDDVEAFGDETAARAWLTGGLVRQA